MNANIIDAKPKTDVYAVPDPGYPVVDATVNPTPCASAIRLCAAQIMTWDKANLNGKVTVNDITETARKYIPEMRAKGADVVVVVAHPASPPTRIRRWPRIWFTT